MSSFRKTYLAAAVGGILVVATVLYGYSLGLRMQTRGTAFLELILNLNSNTTTADLLLAEAVRHDDLSQASAILNAYAESGDLLRTLQQEIEVNHYYVWPAPDKYLELRDRFSEINDGLRNVGEAAARRCDDGLWT